MKRFLLLLSLAGCFENNIVHGQITQPALTQETQFPDVNYSFNNSSAYSFGNLIIPGSPTPTDLYVFTWDNFTAGPSGMAIREGSVYYNESAVFPADNTTSVEAAILKNSFSGAVYILVSYYQQGSQQFMVDLYNYTSGGGLTQITGFPQPITAFSSTAPPAWIHLDAYNLNNFMITWQENGQILAKAGKVNPVPGGNIIMGNTAVLDNSSISLGLAAQPDVALIESAQAGQLMAHFVYTDQAEQTLVAASLSYNVVFNTPTPLALLTPVFDDYQQNVNSRFLRPRIDAPDNFNTDDWSYVVDEVNAATNQNLIFAGVKHQGILSHYNLNDGSLGTLPDISSTLTGQFHESEFPVVAYADNGTDIYYGWYYFSQYNPPWPTNDYDYIGLKLHNGSLIGPPNQYWQLQYYPNSTMVPIGTLAFSGQNTNSPGLFAVFEQIAYSGLPGSIASKVIPWTQTRFRPVNQSPEVETDSSENIKVSPNPFSRSFQIQTNSANLNVYQLKLTDVMGRAVLNLEGTIQQINRKLSSSQLVQLPVGNYFLSIYTGNGTLSYHFKLVKTN